MQLDSFMKEFAKEMELTEDFPLILGSYSLPLEDDLTVSVTPIPNGFTLYCSLIACPQTNRESFFSQLLLANLFGQGTRGAILGLNEDGNRLTLSKTIDYTIDYKGFRDVIEDFINVIDFWREETLAQNKSG